MITDIFHKIGLKIKKSENRFYRHIYNMIISLRRMEMPFPTTLATLVFSTVTLFNAFLSWFVNTFYCKPMLRGRCEHLGKGLIMEASLPQIYGKGRIIIGDNVMLGNRNTWVFRGNVYDNVELVIGNNVTINYQTLIDVAQKVEIKDRVLMAGQVIIFDNNVHSVDYRNRNNLTDKDISPVIIEEDVWIGTRAVILKGVTIGRGSIVAAMSVVTKSVPPYSLVAGNPAKVVKNLKFLD